MRITEDILTIIFMFIVVLLYIVDEFQKICIKFKSYFTFPWQVLYLKGFYFELFSKSFWRVRNDFPDANRSFHLLGFLMQDIRT